MYAFEHGITRQHSLQVNNSRTIQDHTIYIKLQSIQSTTNVVVFRRKCNFSITKKNTLAKL